MAIEKRSPATEVMTVTSYVRKDIRTFIGFFLWSNFALFLLLMLTPGVHTDPAPSWLIAFVIHNLTGPLAAFIVRPTFAVVDKQHLYLERGYTQRLLRRIIALIMFPWGYTGLFNYLKNENIRYPLYDPTTSPMLDVLLLSAVWLFLIIAVRSSPKKLSMQDTRVVVGPSRPPDDHFIYLTSPFIFPLTIGSSRSV